MHNHLLLRHFHQLRTALFHTELQLLQAPVNGKQSCQAALAQVQEVLQRCARCADFTAKELLPLLETYEPAVADALRRQQATLNAHHLAAVVAAYPVNATIGEQELAMRRLIERFDGIVLEQMSYLVRLQQHLLPLLEKHYGTAILNKLGQKLEGRGSEPATTHSAADTGFRAYVFRAEHALAQTAAAAPV